MELVTHYSRSFRRAYDRSISEEKYENYHYREDIFKGHNQNCSEFNSYHSHSLVNSLNEMRAKDLTVDKKGSSNVRQPQHQNNKINGICASRIKQEVVTLARAASVDEDEHSLSLHHHPQPQPQQIVKENRQMIAIRRYFCIFCKMDFSHPEDFLDHLELHPNGSFVLVKRDQIHSPDLSPKEQQQHHLLNHNDNNNSIIDNNLISGKNNNNNNVSDNENKNRISSHSNEHFEATEEEISNLPIIPEMLKNQIKIEPISEDEEEEERQVDAVTAEIANDNEHINKDEELQRHQLQQQHSTTSSSSVHFNIDGAEINLHSPSPEVQTNETSDPNHQLLVLSNPRIGDGPGEYLCNVCHAKFVYKNNLKSHLKRHLGIYPYVCFCGKRYQFKCKLSKHIEQAHAKIKNFKCPVPTCPKKYFTRNDLAFHISVTHQERQEIPCSICQKVFNSQKSLQIHCRKYHRNQES